jgi:hypothetical protein
LNKQNNHPLAEIAIEKLEQTENMQSSTDNQKKPFIEPIVSVPVDVLEATTFFQGPTLDVADA